MLRDDQPQKHQTAINMNVANAKEHAQRAERNNRTDMPFTHLPRTLVEHVVMQSSKKSKCFPLSMALLSIVTPE